MRYVFVALMCVFAGIYAAVKFKGNFTERLLVKAIASVSFLMIAYTGRIGSYPPYYTLILAGLCFSVAGDVLLVFSDKRVFLAGCIAFLLAHAGYIAAFFVFAPPAWVDAALLIGFVAVGVAFYAVNRHAAGKLNPFVFVYALALCVMVAKAVSMLFAEGVTKSNAIFAALGGTLFAISDMMLAYGRLHAGKQKKSGVLNVVFYYAGQALIALSVAT